LVRRDGFEAEAFSEVPSAWGQWHLRDAGREIVPRYFLFGAPSCDLTWHAHLARDFTAKTAVPLPK